MTDKRVIFLMLSAALILMGALGAPAAAEEPQGALELQLKPSSKRPSALVLPAADIVQTDTERAIREIKARERLDRLVQEAVQGPRWRPDLTYDVVSGIQARNINSALGRR